MMDQETTPYSISTSSSVSAVFWPEPMVLCHLLLQPTIIFDVVADLGSVGLVQFRDLNAGILNAFQRTFVDETSRIEICSQKLAYLSELVHKNFTTNEHYLEETLSEEIHSVPCYRSILSLANSIDEWHRNIRDIDHHLRSMRKKQIEWNELHQVLYKTQPLVHFITQGATNGQMGNASRRQSWSRASFTGQASVEQDLATRAAQFQFLADRLNHQLYLITGIISRDRAASFHTMIWRIAAHNVLVDFFDCDSPSLKSRNSSIIQNELGRISYHFSEGEQSFNTESQQEDDYGMPEKKVFLLLCSSKQLYAKLKRICSGFHATTFELPLDVTQHRDLSIRVLSNIDDLKLVVRQTMLEKRRMLTETARRLKRWQAEVAKLQEIFAMMNLFQRTGDSSGFIGECWCAKADFIALKSRIEVVMRRFGVPGQAAVQIVTPMEPLVPPTYFRSNQITDSVQQLVDAYGVAAHNELNPAPFTIITFPFLFSIMFADIGHGVLLVLIASGLIWYRKKIAYHYKNLGEITQTFYRGRYLLLLMGLFSIYSGAIFKDCFSKVASISGGTSFALPNPENFTQIYLVPGEEAFRMFNYTIYLRLSQQLIIDSQNYHATPFGIDPAWQFASNKVVYLNSYKMKLSIILGVAQMSFGLILQLANHWNRSNWLNIITESIPQLFYLWSLFGYLVVLIFIKWCTHFEPTHLAPSLLIDFINMFADSYPDNPAYLRPWFEYKADIQRTLLFICFFCCIPLMLLVKPLIVWSRPTRNFRPKASTQDQEDIELYPLGGENTQQQSKVSEVSNERFSLIDICISQIIHTVEYCLGTISHTASYLRLWALSLAHAQLSEVLWSMIMKPALSHSEPMLLCVAFSFWASLTVMIMLLMEGLSAFLHALRLHWIEFQSKFYNGTGQRFKPFYFCTKVREIICT